MAAEVIGPGRVAVVTGAASGIGRAMAQAFAAEGSTVVLADVDLAGLDAVAAELRASGANVEIVPTDVSDPAAVEALAATTIDRCGRVDVVCNNAGVSTFNLIADQTLADWQWVFGVNLWGVVHGIQAFLPILREQGSPAHIINTSSLGGLMGGVHFIGPYVATKAAVIAISETLAKEMELTGQPIRVSVLCPGATESGVMESERVRPEAFGTEARGEMAEATRRAIKDMMTGPAGSSADAVAAQVIDAIRADRFWIITSPWEQGMVDARSTEMLAAFPPVPADA